MSSRKVRGRVARLTPQDRKAKKAKDQRRGRDKERAVRVWARQHIRGER